MSNGPTDNDRILAKQALQKRQEGKKPTAPELAALRRVEKQREETLRWQYYTTIPHKHWREMSGRKANQINEQADRYGIPFSGATIDLPKVVRALHEFLAKNARKLGLEDDPLLAGGSDSPNLEEYRKQKARIAKVDADEAERLVGRFDQLQPGFQAGMSFLRQCGERLERVYGAEAGKMFNEAVDEAIASIEKMFNDEGNAFPNPDIPDGKAQPSADDEGVC